MGWVFLARHQELQRACALKILSPRLLDEDQDYLLRFQNEGRAAAALVHPNIVTTHAIGRHGDSHFIEMEFVPGRSLQHRLESMPLTPLRAVTLTAQIASGLAAAHRSGVLHRDLKPDNILLTHQQIPKIGDFGLAKKIASQAAGNEQLVGTPNFMAPELFTGDPATPASDVYALGVCLFLLLTRRLPFRRPRLSQLIAAVRAEPLPNLREFNPAISLEVCECVSLMLAKSPTNRPRDGIEAAQLLQAVMGQARDLESLLHEALDDEAFVERRRENGRNELIVTLPDGRRQTVYIEESDHTAADRLLLIYTVCCRADPEFFVEALKLNAEVSHGAIAIREVDGRPHFVMIDSYPRASVDGDSIRRSVMELANHADAIEHRLTGADHN
jgi:serine/threonine-protein kinase